MSVSGGVSLSAMMAARRTVRLSLSSLNAASGPTIGLAKAAAICKNQGLLTRRRGAGLCWGEALSAKETRCQPAVRNACVAGLLAIPGVNVGLDWQ